jgi:FkbM family methyltransferase
MRPSTFGRRACRKLRYLLEKPYTWFQTIESGLPLRAPMNHGERCVLIQLQHYLQGEDLVVYDIGASYGSYTKAFAKMSRVGRIVAFEPIPPVFASLAADTAKHPHVTCLQLALGDTDGPSTFHQSEFSYSSSMLPMEQLHKTEFPQSAASTAITVESARLDRVVEERGLPSPDFVKMDVQGFEDRVIRGGRETLRKARYCMLEMSLFRLYEGAPLFDDLYSVMRELGFHLVGVVDQVTGASGRMLQIDAVFERDGSA